MKIVSVWSGPRNVSTALMYSFAQRADTTVMDEPFYGHFLAETPDANHPGRTETLELMETDHRVIIQNILSHQQAQGLLFIKNMAHHLIFDEQTFMNSIINVFLIRDPREMLTSLIKNIPDATLRDTGLKTQLDLFHEMASNGQETIVLDSKEIRLDPKKILSRFCEFLEIPFDAAMLSWEAGPRPEDGNWAKYWYHNVHQSTGFAPYHSKDEKIPEHLEPLLQECIEIYDQLYMHAIKA